MKWWLKSCPRCRGDLYRDTHSKSGDIVCLQCGAVFYRHALLGGFPISRRREEEPLGARADKH